MAEPRIGTRTVSLRGGGHSISLEVPRRLRVNTPAVTSFTWRNTREPWMQMTDVEFMAVGCDAGANEFASITNDESVWSWWLAKCRLGTAHLSYHLRDEGPNAIRDEVKRAQVAGLRVESGSVGISVPVDSAQGLPALEQFLGAVLGIGIGFLGFLRIVRPLIRPCMD
jgi:hypothetical protein